MSETSVELRKEGVPRNGLAGSPETAARMARLRERANAAERFDPIEKAKRNPKSRQLAITAKCYDCEGRNADPCWQWRVGNCRIPDCSLYPHRPFQRLMGTPTPKALRVQE